MVTCGVIIIICCSSLPTKTPIVNGIEIDLYLFYMLVQQRGGLGKVCIFLLGESLFGMPRWARSE